MMMMVSYQSFFVVFVVLFLALSDVQATASNSLANCQTAASAFRSTISYTATNITATTGVNVTCSATGVVCPGVNISGVCVWQRKLSAVCRNASGVIKIRIQTNGLPPRCASVPMGTFVELNVDFEVNFNPDVSINSPNQNLSTVSLLSTTLCVLTSVSTVPSASGYVNYGTTGLDTATGVSVDGVMIFSADSANDIDPFFPPPGLTTETVDSCLAHCQTAGIYHYHIASGCQVNPPNGSISSCGGTPSCISNVANYSIASYSNYQTMTVIGVAKDGHVIYGPYLSANTRVTSGFDVCNGMFYDSIGNYAYFATSTYPYLVGCFGSANYPSFGPNCTSNGVSSYNMSSYAISFLSNSSNSTTASTTSTTISSMNNSGNSTTFPPSTTTMPPMNNSSNFTTLPPSTTTMPPMNNSGNSTTLPPSTTTMPPMNNSSNSTTLPPSTTTMPPMNNSSNSTTLPPSTTTMPPMNNSSNSTTLPPSTTTMPPMNNSGNSTTLPPSTTAMPPMNNSSNSTTTGSSSTTMLSSSSSTMSSSNSTGRTNATSKSVGVCLNCGLLLICIVSMIFLH